MKEYNIYDVGACQDAILRIQSMDISVDKKAGHNTRLSELRETVESLRAINYYVFDPDVYEPCYRYQEAVRRGEKKTRLDYFLRIAVSDIVKDLRGLIEIEYMTYDGRLIRNPLFARKPHLREWIEPGEVENMLRLFG